jgi:hypothetical protein
VFRYELHLCSLVFSQSEFRDNSELAEGIKYLYAVLVKFHKAIASVYSPTSSARSRKSGAISPFPHSSSWRGT